jgi:hypothetical protein
MYKYHIPKNPSLGSHSSDPHILGPAQNQNSASFFEPQSLVLREEIDVLETVCFQPRVVPCI